MAMICLTHYGYAAGAQLKVSFMLEVPSSSAAAAVTILNVEPG